MAIAIARLQRGNQEGSSRKTEKGAVCLVVVHLTLLTKEIKIISASSPSSSLNPHSNVELSPRRVVNEGGRESDGR